MATLLDGQEVAKSHLVQVTRSALTKIASKSTLNNWCAVGKLPALKVGARWFAKSETIQGFLTGQREAI